MQSRARLRILRHWFMALLLAASASCIESVRVPLAVPLPVVGGSRPATPQGLELIGEFGDGVWGQEQERAEMAGAGLGFAIDDRLELGTGGYASTRTVKTESGSDHYGETTVGTRGKMRIADLLGGRAAVAVHVAFMSAERERSDEQDERLTALDLALPVEIYRVGELFTDYRFGLYAGPRVVFQTFEDRLTRETTKGTMAAAVVGLAGRWRHFAAMGEMNFARTPTMSFRDATFDAGWHLLPMLGVRGLIPIGD